MNRKPKMEMYDKYNYCAKCAEWLEGKPIRCPDCHYLARTRPRYRKSKYFYSHGAKRY